MKKIKHFCFLFLLKLFVLVNGQYVQSPCPGIFDYQSDGANVYGVIRLNSNGPVSSVSLRVKFTVAIRLLTNYVGRIEPVGDNQAIVRFNKGEPLVYRVHFPVTNPLPRLTELVVNGNLLCHGPGESPRANVYITTISLSHVLYIKTSPGSVYNQDPVLQIGDFGNNANVYTFNDIDNTSWNTNNNRVSDVVENTPPEFIPKPSNEGARPPNDYYTYYHTEPSSQVARPQVQGTVSRPSKPVQQSNSQQTNFQQQPQNNAQQSQNNIPAQQPQNNFQTQQSQNNFPAQQPQNNFQTQQPQNNLPAQQPQNNFQTQQPQNNFPAQQPQNNFQTQQPQNNFPAQQTQNNFQTQQPQNNIPAQPQSAPPAQVQSQRPEIPSTPSRLPANIGSNAVECGVIAGGNERVPLIYNGQSYERGDWPWLVAIYRRKEGSLTFICAGTLVSDRHAVTAAHCMHQKNKMSTLKDIVVKIGVYNLEDWGDDVSVTRTLMAAEIHKSYNASTLENDVLIMTFERKVQFNTYIRPACLWNGNADLSRIVGASGVVAGWGSSELGPSGQGEPRMVRIPIVSTAACRASKPEFHRLTSANTLCAGDRKGSGPCNGDSGGGLYILDGGRWRLRGVVSLSLRPQNGDNSCNLNEYIVFTDTAQYLGWIRTVISQNLFD